jgi:Ca-activated chloride channel family protein
MIVGRYKDGGKATIKLRGKVGDETKEFEYKVEFPEESSEHEFVARLWGTRRVGHLLDEISHNGENAELKDEVTQLARQYGIVTPYTSYLVSEDEVLAQRDRLPTLLHMEVPGSSSDSLSFYKRNSTDVRRYGSSTAPAPIIGERLSRLSDHTGDAAVAGSRYNYALKSAANEQEIQLAPAEVRLFVETGKLQAERGGGSAQAQRQQFVGNRTFRFEQGSWTETTLREGKDTETKRIEFDSDEYWKLLTQHPELREILAMGTQVKFQLGNQICEIYPKKI